MDSGATHHFTPEFGNLTDTCVFTVDEQAMVGNGKLITISHIGNAMISSPMKPIHLKYVLHTPQISKQLINVTKLCYDNQAFVEFYHSHFLVKDQDSRRVLLQGILEDGLYKVSSSVCTSPSLTVSS